MADTSAQPRASQGAPMWPNCSSICRETTRDTKNRTNISIKVKRSAPCWSPEATRAHSVRCVQHVVDGPPFPARSQPIGPVLTAVLGQDAGNQQQPQRQCRWRHPEATASGAADTQTGSRWRWCVSSRKVPPVCVCSLGSRRFLKSCSAAQQGAQRGIRH